MDLQVWYQGKKDMEVKVRFWSTIFWALQQQEI